MTKKKRNFYIVLSLSLMILAIVAHHYARKNGMIDSTIVYKVEFKNITDLAPGADVTLRGVKIGKVSNIIVDKNRPASIIAEIKLSNLYKIPKDATVIMKSGGLMDGNILAVEFDQHCTGANCAGRGFMFKTRTLGMMESMFGENPMEDELGVKKEDMDETMEALKNKITSEDNIIGTTLQNINFINAKMTAMGKEMEGVTRKYTNEYKEVMGNLDGLNQIMKDDKVNQITEDLKIISNTMESVDFDKPMNHAKRTMAKVDELKKEASIRMKDLDATMAKSKEALSSFDEIKEKMNSSEGSVKYLMAKEGLQTDLNETKHNLNRLGEDIDYNTFYYKPFLCRRKFLRKNPDKR